MLFSFSDEQDALRTAVRSFVKATVSEAEVRRVMATSAGYDPTTWDRMAKELGLPGLVVPERFDGAGAGLVELAIVVEELAGGLYPGPFTSTALATTILVEAGDESLAEAYLPGIAAGTIKATVAVAERDGRWAVDAVRCAARSMDDGWRLSGTKRFVADAQSADLLIVAARSEAQPPALFVVDAGADGVAVTPRVGFDQTTRLADVEFTDVAARRLTAASEGEAMLTRALDVAATLASAEAVGGAQRSLDMAVSYAKDRIQFGRAIGSFQAIKHMCADMLLDVESARSAAYYAAWAGADHAEDFTMVAALSKAFCSDVFFQTASNSMQIHGGISFTWEHPAHLYYRRAKSARQLWGDPRSHRDHLVTELGL